MKDAIASIKRVATLLCERGWAEGSAGNISVRLAQIPSLPGPRRYMLPMEPPSDWSEGTSLLITAAGCRMQDLSVYPERYLMVISFHPGQREAMLYGLPDMEPSSELSAHLQVHGTLIRSGSKAIALLHAHVTELVALTHHPDLQHEQGFNDVLMRMHPETMFFVPGGVALLDLGIPGSLELAALTARAFEGKTVCVWAMHGALACGRDLHEAFDRLDMIAKAARIWLICKAAGFSPLGLKPNQITSLGTAYGIHGF